MKDNIDREIQKLKELKDQSVENFIVAKINAGVNEHVAQYIGQQLDLLGYKEEEEEK